MSVKTSPAKRDGAVRRILRGESTVEAEARKLRVSTQAIRRFVTLARRGAPTSSAPEEDAGSNGVGGSFDSGSSAPDGSSSPDLGSDRATDTRLARALRSAGADGTGSLGSTPEADEDTENGPPAPPISPEKFLAFVETVRSVGLRIYAGFIGVPTDDPRAVEIFEMSKGERDTLLFWAPEAAEEFGPYLGADNRIGAWTFAGIFVAGLWGATGRLKALKPAPENVDPASVPIGHAPIGTSNGPGVNSRSTLMSPFER
jgi:transposase-like protein